MDVKYIFILSLLLYPALGLILGYATRNHPLVRRLLIVPIFVVGTIAIVAGIFGFSTTSIGVDFVLYASVYLSISLGLWYIFFKKSRILAAILMLILYCAGYVFSLALPLTGDIVPKIAIRLGDDIIYKERFVPADYAGREVEVFKVYHRFFEKRILSKTYLDEAPAFVNDTLVVRYSPENKKIYLSIPQGVDKYTYTFHQNFNLNWVDSLNLID